MDRRKLPATIEPGSLFGLLAILGLLWLTGQCLQNLPDGAGNLSSLIIMGAFAIGAACPAMVRGLQRVGAIRLRASNSASAFSPQAAALTAQPATTINSRPAAPVSHTPASAVVAEMATDEHLSLQEFHPGMTPAAFASFCATELLRAGWQACVGMRPTGAQAEVVAERDRLRVAVQCEIDAQPISYRSVQRATAARADEHATFGVVVSNSGFTAAAQHLAANNDILLLHYSDLPQLERLLGRLARQSAYRADTAEAVTTERG